MGSVHVRAQFRGELGKGEASIRMIHWADNLEGGHTAGSTEGLVANKLAHDLASDAGT
jgi:hypothetical protein